MSCARSAAHQRGATIHGVDIAAVTFGGHDCLVVGAGGPHVTVTTDAGPRILALTLPDGTGAGLFAALPELTIDTPGQPPFRMIGGHRLWAAPEVPATTYLPDDGPPEVTRAADSVAFSHLPATALRRTLRVTPTPVSVVIDHVLANDGTEPTRVAPWAITMLTPGGEAWLPRFMGRIDPGGYQANGSLVLWPYSRFDDTRLVPGDPVTRVLAIAGSAGRVKVGLQGRAGWAAYRRADTLLAKRFAWLEGETYPDMDASLQCYSCGDFIELETLGPLVTLSPGESTAHRETWTLARVDPDAPMDELLREAGLAAA
jgi:hypothetical protein